MIFCYTISESGSLSVYYWQGGYNSFEEAKFRLSQYVLMSENESATIKGTVYEFGKKEKTLVEYILKSGSSRETVLREIIKPIIFKRS